MLFPLFARPARTASYQIRRTGISEVGAGVDLPARHPGSALPVRRLLHRSDVDLPHFHHRFGGAFGFGLVGVLHQFDHAVWHDLPGEAELILEPAAYALLAAVSD